MYDIPKILERVANLGHVIFLNGDYNLNLIGVRTKSRVANKFDDWLYCVFKVADKWQELKFAITTDPGLYHIQNPKYVVGTAIMVAGQYRGAYIIGKHRGTTALVQQGNSVKIYRDGNKDEILDHKPESIIKGYFGINIHRSSKRTGGSAVVEKWSAGCQVFKDPDEFDIFMEICDKAAKVWGNRFTYTLIED